MLRKQEKLSKISRGYKTLEALGPEHEFSIVDEELRPLPIADTILKRLCGRIINTVSFRDFALGNELQKHVLELKATKPFRSPRVFEETMYEAVLKALDVAEAFRATLLGSGMHPTLRLDEAEVWDHRDKEIYKAFDEIFGLRQHGWLNIQSFQLNLSYRNECEAVKLYNILAKVIPYIPAISASSPVYESGLGEFADNRLHYYMTSQEKIPSIAEELVPEPIDSFDSYRSLTIHRYSKDLMDVGAPSCLIGKDWVNSRGATIRFDRRAIEIRVMDEQDCIKSDVALSSFARALLRGLLSCDEGGSEVMGLDRSALVQNLNSIIRNGLDSKIVHAEHRTARDLCRSLYDIAHESATQEEKGFLWIVKKRIEDGNLSERIRNHVEKRAQKTDLSEAIFDVYSELVQSLRKNEIYE